MNVRTDVRALAKTAARAAKGFKPNKRGQWHEWVYAQTAAYMAGRPTQVRPAIVHNGGPAVKFVYGKHEAHTAYLPLT